MDGRQGWCWGNEVRSEIRRVLDGLRAMASTDLGGRIGIQVSLISGVEEFNQCGCSSETVGGGRTNESMMRFFPPCHPSNDGLWEVYLHPPPSRVHDSKGCYTK